MFFDKVSQGKVISRYSLSLKRKKKKKTTKIARRWYKILLPVFPVRVKRMDIMRSRYNSSGGFRSSNGNIAEH